MVAKQYISKNIKLIILCVLSTFPKVLYSVYGYKKYALIKIVIMILTTLPTATSQYWNHGVHTKGAKHKKSLNYNPHASPLADLIPLGHF